MQISFLMPGEAQYKGQPHEYVAFLLKNQLLDKRTWQHFVKAYKTNADDYDSGWRGEYWGKMMRGASLIYQYTKDEALYQTLKEATEDLLAAQDAWGRFSTYPQKNEFRGWDVWSRKYVLTGMQHFYDICHEKDMKERIVAALMAHADYILSKIGNEEGKKDITKTSNYWLGVNSASILEPMLRLFQMTGEKRYLEFGRYILSTGGCSGGDLVAMALENKIMPYQYPEVKAYETMSFFEGVLCYGELTGDQLYIQAARNFADAVARTDITVIGSAGCTHELFDHSTDMQTVYSETIMQETCVTVTWMRLMTRLFRYTGDISYMEKLERSAWNSMYGSLNLGMYKQFELSSKTYVAPLAFDSYSPLYNHRRGRGVGGYKVYDDGFYYGCCACIGAAGIALLPLTAVMKGQDTIYVNHLLPGVIHTTTPTGKPMTLEIQGNYPQSGEISIKMTLEEPECFSLNFRIPEGTVSYHATQDDEEISGSKNLLLVQKLFGIDTKISLSLNQPLREEKRNQRTAFLKGAVVMARDEAKEKSGKADLTEQTSIVRKDGHPVATWKDAQEGELFRLHIRKTNGESLLLTDYASCGKNWLLEDARITAWMNIE